MDTLPALRDGHPGGDYLQDGVSARPRRKDIVVIEEGSSSEKVGPMELTIVDELIIYLVEEPRNVPMAMRAAGHTQEEISAAWREARRAGYTESTGWESIGWRWPGGRGPLRLG